VLVPESSDEAGPFATVPSDGRGPTSIAAVTHSRDGFTHAGLWVLDSNEQAMRFYCRRGCADGGRPQLDRGPGGTEMLERRLRRDLSDVTGRQEPGFASTWRSVKGGRTGGSSRHASG